VRLNPWLLNLSLKLINKGSSPKGHGFRSQSQHCSNFWNFFLTTHNKSVFSRFFLFNFFLTPYNKSVFFLFFLFNFFSLHTTNLFSLLFIYFVITFSPTEIFFVLISFYINFFSLRTKNPFSLLYIVLLFLLHWFVLFLVLFFSHSIQQIHFPIYCVTFSLTEKIYFQWKSVWSVTNGILYGNNASSFRKKKQC
jgi:hypothetical protein